MSAGPSKALFAIKTMIGAASLWGDEDQRASKELSNPFCMVEDLSIGSFDSL